MNATAITTAPPAARVTRHAGTERYDVRVASDWAVVLLSEPHGVLSILSNYGNWSHWWPSHGDPSLKHFLLRMGPNDDYLARKFRVDRSDFDFDAACVRLKQAIGRAYAGKRRLYYAGGRAEVFDLEKCRAALDGVKYLDHTRSADDFARQVYERPEFSVIDTEQYEGIINRATCGQFLEFMARLWPPFLAELRRELGEEEAKTP